MPCRRRWSEHRGGPAARRGQPDALPEAAAAFVRDESDAALRIREWLAAGDNLTAERVAHTVRGVAGIQARGRFTPLPVTSSAPSESGRHRLTASAMVSRTRCQALVAAVHPVLGEAQTERLAGPAAADPVTIRDAVTRMMRCLSEFDPAAVECLDSDHSAFRAVFDAATLTQFERHINGYAFAEAQILLNEAMLARGISLKETPAS